MVREYILKMNTTLMRHYLLPFLYMDIVIMLLFLIQKLFFYLSDKYIRALFLRDLFQEVKLVFFYPTEQKQTYHLSVLGNLHHTPRRDEQALQCLNLW